jgi:GTP pyrophosphokinase
LESDIKLKKEKEDCWRVYSLVTNIYTPNPKRLRDWITTPKASGYESLHTTVQGMNDKWIEVQIRTNRMDEEAEKGQAAHWNYKGVMKKKDTENWLSQVRDILENPDQLFHDENYKSNGGKQNESVFVFTPMGDLKQFPKGATVLDFAFGIHTDLGSKCSGAIINKKVVPIRYELQNGDKVEIISNKNQLPKDDWLTVVTTDKAKTRIRKYLKEIKYTEADIGKSLLTRKFKNWKVKLSDELMAYVLKHFKLEAAIDLYYKVAIEEINLADVRNVVNTYTEEFLSGKKVAAEQQKTEQVKDKITHRDDGSEILYIGNNLKSVDYRMAKCCNPIHGDKVFGFITTMGGITIHRVNCPNAKRLREKYDYRILDVSWIDSDKQTLSTVILKINGVDRLGLVGEITKVISDDLRVNMRSISFETSGKKFMGKVSVTIRNYSHLEQLIAKLLKVKGVDKVLRAK